MPAARLDRAAREHGGADAPEPMGAGFGFVLAVFERVVEEGALVPPIWRIEVANALLMGQRRKRIPNHADRR